MDDVTQSPVLVHILIVIFGYWICSAQINKYVLPVHYQALTINSFFFNIPKAIYIYLDQSNSYPNSSPTIYLVIE